MINDISSEIESKSVEVERPWKYWFTGSNMMSMEELSSIASERSKGDARTSVLQAAVEEGPKPLKVCVVISLDVALGQSAK